MRGWQSCVLFSIFAACGGGGGGGGSPDARPAPDAPGDTTAPTTTASPTGGVYRALPSVTLTADEPATIYYTNDGNPPGLGSTHATSPISGVSVTAGVPLQFFAVDSAGNQESIRSVTYTMDRLGPAAVSDFAATASGNDVALSWASPVSPGFTDVVIARVTDVAATAPTDGAALAVNDTVGAGTVIYVGSGTSFTDTNPGAGHHTYLAWAHYDTGNYAEGVAAGARLEPAAQTCQITVDVTGGTATVSTQPSAWTLAIANYANNAGTITFDVSATSALAGVTFDPKLVFTQVGGTGGTPTLNAPDGTVDLGNGAVPYQYFGPNGVDLGGVATKTLSVTANGATAMTLDCQMVADQAMLTTHWCASGDGGSVFDVRAAKAFAALPVPSRYASGARTCSGWAMEAVSPDGRYAYLAPRSGKRVVKVDTTTWSEVGGIDFTVTQPTAAAARIALDPSGRRLYVGLQDGTHEGGYASDTQDNGTPSAGTTTGSFLAEVATADMTETSRTSLGTGDKMRRLIRIALSADGRTLATLIGAPNMAASNSELHVVDVSTWTDEDFDSATTGLQTFPIGTVVRGPAIVFDPTGRYLMVGQSNASGATTSFGVADLQAGTFATYTSPEGRVIDGARIGGELYVLDDSQTRLYTLDPATGATTALGTATFPAGRAWGLTASADGTRLYVESATFVTVDATTGAVLGSTNATGRPANVHSPALTP